MQFKVDENLPAEIAHILRANGHDALTIQEQKLVGSPDVTIAHVCRDEARALVSLDMDFANIHAYPPEKHAGIIVLRLTLQDNLTCSKSFIRCFLLFQKSRWTSICGSSKKAAFVFVRSRRSSS